MSCFVACGSAARQYVGLEFDLDDRRRDRRDHDIEIVVGLVEIGVVTRTHFRFTYRTIDRGFTRPRSASARFDARRQFRAIARKRP